MVKNIIKQKGVSIAIEFDKFEDFLFNKKTFRQNEKNSK